MSDTLLSNKLHDLLVLQMKSIPAQDIAIFLSGGIDSQAVLFALLEAGKTVHAYTFTRADIESDDCIKAKEVCEIFNIPLRVIKLPTDLATIKRDLIRLNKQYGCKKKIEYECFWPFLYAYPVVKEKVIVGGFSIEGSLATGRDYALHYKPDIKRYRDDCWLEINRSQRIQHYIIGLEYDVFHYFPFQDQEVYRLLYESSYADCNSPKDKSVVINMFPEQFSKFKVRQPQNLQLGKNGIADLFADLLLNSDWNNNNYKSVVGIYNRVNRGEFSNGKRKLI